MAAHTTGPWAIDSELPPNARPVIARATCSPGLGLAISANAENCDVSEEEDRANARLIAAAPDLYDSLDELYEEYSGRVPYHSAACDCDTCGIHARARVALKKAEGHK